MLAARRKVGGPPVHAWLTDVQAALFSDMDNVRVASILEHTHALLGTPEQEAELPVEACPVLKLQVGSCLDRGIRRKSRPNEDSIFIAQGILHGPAVPPRPFALLIVADGMGGQTNGQEAGHIAIQSLVEYVYTSLVSRQTGPNELMALLCEGIQHANALLHQRNREQLTHMGTTITAALVSDATACVANVGDSRMYLYHCSSGLFQVTRDHSLVAALAEAGMIRPDEIYTHPRRNLIYRCLGEKPTVQVDTFVVTFADGDLLLLCSDGLWEMVRDPQIEKTLADSASMPSQKASMLVQVALAAGGPDNVSAIVAQASKACST